MRSGSNWGDLITERGCGVCRVWWRELPTEYVRAMKRDQVKSRDRVLMGRCHARMVSIS